LAYCSLFENLSQYSTHFVFQKWFSISAPMKENDSGSILARQFLPRLKKQLPESCAVIDYSPLQGPIAQPEFARHCRNLRPAFRPFMGSSSGRILSSGARIKMDLPASPKTFRTITASTLLPLQNCLRVPRKFF
jgi:hypothetical protein